MQPLFQMNISQFIIKKIIITMIEENKLQFLQDLKAKQIQELKAFKNPPEKVKIVGSAVVFLLESSMKKINLTYQKFQAVMASPQISIKRIVQYDKTSISMKRLEVLENYISFHKLRVENGPQQTKKVSNAAYNMHKWVLAVVEFAKIYKEEHPEEEEIMVSVHDTESVYSVLSETLSGVARADITQLKSYMNPSIQTKTVIAGVIYVLDETISKIHIDKLWSNFTKIMIKSPEKFLTSMKQCDAKSLSKERIQILQNYVKVNELDGINGVDKSKKVSKAVFSMHKWLLTLIQEAKKE